jgi:hypothetical protein
MMSDRERWIVYPLLFFALALHLKGAVNRPSNLECRSIRCNELVIEALNGTPRARMGSSRWDSGEVRLYGAGGKPSLVLSTDRLGQRGTLHTLDGTQQPQTVIGSDSGGGYLKILGKPGVPTLYLGHDGDRQISGLLALNEQNQPMALSVEDTAILWGMPFRWPPGAKPKAEPEDATTDRAQSPSPARSGVEGPVPSESDSSPPPENKDAQSSANDRGGIDQPPAGPSPQ